VIKINHRYHVHNYYSWFESIRHRYSPRFRNQENLKETNLKTNFPKQNFLIWEFLKFMGKVIAHIGCFWGEITNHGEVITVYAKKA